MEIKEARRIAKAHNNGTAVIDRLAVFTLTGADVLALNTEVPAMRKLGTDDSYNVCDLCDGGEDVHYGTECATAYDFARRYAA